MPARLIIAGDGPLRAQVRATIDRRGDVGAGASRLEAAIAELTSRMQTAGEPASDRAALNETLQMLLSRLADWAPAARDGYRLDDLSNRIDALRAAVESHADSGPDLSALAAEVAEIRQRQAAWKLQSAQVAADALHADLDQLAARLAALANR